MPILYWRHMKQPRRTANLFSLRTIAKLNIPLPEPPKEPDAKEDTGTIHSEI